MNANSEPDSLRNAEFNDDQRKRIELNRLKAKMLRRKAEEGASQSTSSHETNVNNKRPMVSSSSIRASSSQVVDNRHDGKGKGVEKEAGPSTATSSGDANKREVRPLRRDARLGKYFDYDLSKMVNSKGGFLVDDAEEASIEDLRTRERERERERAMQNLDPPMFLERDRNPKCQECGSLDIDQTFRKVLRCLVCNKCKNEHTEKYSLLTKTECKEDYLLTDAELRDEELMPHLLKANPHKSTYSNMMLFLRCQVEDFAWKKWGSPEALDKEFERREGMKKKKKKKKFEEGLAKLRKQTRESVWQMRKDKEHKHIYGITERGEDGVGRQVCHECGFTIEVEEL